VPFEGVVVPGRLVVVPADNCVVTYDVPVIICVNCLALLEVAAACVAGLAVVC